MSYLVPIYKEDRDVGSFYRVHTWGYVFTVPCSSLSCPQV